MAEEFSDPRGTVLLAVCVGGALMGGLLFLDDPLIFEVSVLDSTPNSISV